MVLNISVLQQLGNSHSLLLCISLFILEEVVLNLPWIFKPRVLKVSLLKLPPLIAIQAKSYIEMHEGAFCSIDLQASFLFYF